MPLTAAERSKRYRERIKQDPEKHEAHKKKELKRLKKHSKKINELTEEEKVSRRKRWREQKRNQKEKKNSNIEVTVQQATPVLKQKQEASTSFKIKHRKLSNNYKKALNNIEKYKTTIQNLRKKLYRAKQNHEKEQQQLQAENNKLKARQEVMEIALQEAYKDTKRLADKRIIKKVAFKLCAKMSKKPERKLLGLKGQVRKSSIMKRPKNKNVAEDLERFFNRDDISRSTAGKRETRTKNKKKMQIRYLIDTLQNLYQIYKAEGGKYSFTTFFRHKPFYVISPSATSRSTCMCIKHSNVEFMYEALKMKRVIIEKTLKDLLKKISCDTKSFHCMYNKCDNCKVPNIIYNEDKLQDEVTWFKWDRVTHKYEKSGQEFLTKKTTKKQIKGTVRELIQNFEKELPNFKTHCFNWQEQQRQYRNCITNMNDDEIGILCDFSENYECKYKEEIQSMHFGASKNTITLHCGVILGKERAQSFVTVSDNNCHEPNAIWAHLMPVIKLAKEEFPNTKIIHFFSDGPSTQYRQKKNFYLLNLFTPKLNLKYSTWSFSESGHGKSMADGIGGAVKRQLDKRVAYGNDITNATEACRILQSTMKSVKCFYVSENDVQNFRKLIPDDLRPVPRTMLLHQIISIQPNQIGYRELSCFCGESRGLCCCYYPKTHIFTNRIVTEQFTETSETTMLENDVNNISALEVFSHPEQSIVTNLEPSTSQDPAFIEFPLNWPLLDNETDIINNIVEDFDPMIIGFDSLPIESFDKVEASTSADVKIPDSIPTVSDAYSPTAKRVKILKPYDDSPSKPLLLMNNKAHRPKKTIKTLLPNKENKITSSSRTYPCHVCKTRKQFILQEMVKCMVCKHWVCISCSKTTFFDYICPICLTD